jgi:CO/xanthine dehydrogenase FAD-binding subunit
MIRAGFQTAATIIAALRQLDSVVSLNQRSNNRHISIASATTHPRFE